MSVKMQQAISYFEDNNAEKAIPLLEDALAYYLAAGNGQACCIIYFYLAFAAICTNNHSQILPYLEKAFTWLTGNQFDALPEWWHSETIAEVCKQAIAADLYIDIVHQLCVQHLGVHAVRPLADLIGSDDLDTQRRAQHILNVINGKNELIISHLPDSKAKAIILNLLENGQLLAEGYPQLERKLLTAKQRRHPNPTIIAVFGLYVFGYQRDVMAQMLECSMQNVRNYITEIYRCYKLQASDFRRREDRRQALIQLARQNGFIA